MVQIPARSGPPARGPYGPAFRGRFGRGTQIGDLTGSTESKILSDLRLCATARLRSELQGSSRGPGRGTESKVLGDLRLCATASSDLGIRPRSGPRGLLQSFQQPPWFSLGVINNPISLP